VALVVAADFFRGRPVLVTGGTGFIGRRLVAALREQGARVRVLARSIGGIPPDWGSVETVAGDLTDAASLARACAGIDAVIHAAGFAHAEAAMPDFAARHWTVNAEGTFHLLDAAVAARVERFVFLSSVKATGDPGPRCVDETWDAPPETPYGRAKRAAEARVLTVGRETGLHAVNLRPALVYGPGMKANLARLIEAVRRGWCPPLPESGNRRSLVHVDDVVQAGLLAAAHPAAAGQTYLVTDGRSYSGRELYLLIRQALGSSAPRWAVPASMLYGTAALADGARWLTGRRDRPARAALDKLLGWACYDSSRIERELGYRPDWTFQRYCEAGLTEWREE
jgi:nucleoside-diphosphate-sugar epimerase